jgi:hypothetical protein
VPLKRPFPPKKSSSKDDEKDDKAKSKSLPPWLRKGKK